jgi:hypothetical protein
VIFRGVFFERERNGKFSFLGAVERFGTNGWDRHAIER